MNINKINNLSFSAKIGYKLNTEIIQKRNNILNQRYLNKTMLVRFDESVQEIKDTLPDATVDIDEKDSASYKITMPDSNSENQVFFSPRYTDIDFYDYCYLRNKLNRLSQNSKN